MLRSRRFDRAARFEPLESRTLLSAADPAADWTRLRNEYHLSGEGQTVAVIDSGIDYQHQALGQGFGAGHHVVGGADFSGDHPADPMDNTANGMHGTAVAGIVGSLDAAHPGIAPGADLVALRVYDSTGESYFGWVKQALEWVHTNRNALAHPITTVTLSLGDGGVSESPPTWAQLEPALEQLQEDGIFVAVAAGNGFAANHQIGLCYPASSPYVVPVAAADTDGNLSSYTQRDARVVVAPGQGILSTVPDSSGNRDGVDNDFVRDSGTSMATPIVAGASVLLREAYRSIGVTNVDQQTLYQVMLKTSDTVFDPVTGTSYHRLNLDRAIQSIEPAKVTAPQSAAVDAVMAAQAAKPKAAAAATVPARVVPAATVAKKAAVPVVAVAVAAKSAVPAARPAVRAAAVAVPTPAKTFSRRALLASSR